MERLFTLEEARAMLATLRPLLAELASAQDQLSSAPEARAVGANGHPRAAQSLADRLATISELVSAVSRSGVVLREPASGLVDFPSERNGRPIYLCWRLGEDDIAFWHPMDTGVAGRQPL